MSELARSQRWQRRKDARPAELLDAALAEFFEKGFAAARLEDIAARAGVSKGTVYLYFASKEEMFEALVQTIPKANVEQARVIAADGSVPAEDLVRRLLQFMGALMGDERMMKFPRLIISDGGRFPKLAETYKREVISRGVGIFSTVIERGIREGVFRDVDARKAAFAAIAPLLFSAIWRTTFERFDDELFDTQGFVAQHIETFLRGIKRGADT